MTVPLAISRAARLIDLDVDVMSVTPLAAGTGTAGTAVDVLLNYQDFTLELPKRLAIDVSGAGDTDDYDRAGKFTGGTLRITGLDDAAGSILAVIFAQGSHALVVFTTADGADSYSFIIFVESYGDAIKKNAANMSTFSGKINGPVQYAGGGGDLADMVLA